MTLLLTSAKNQSLVPLSEQIDSFGIPLLEDFKTSAQRFIEQGGSETEVKNAIEDFKALKPRITDPVQKDIDRWKSWDEFKAFVDDLKGTTSKTQAKKLAKMEGARFILENDGWQVYQITTHAASRLYGSNTQWCITSEDPYQWTNYASKAHIYFLISKIPLDQDHNKQFNKIAHLVYADGSLETRDENDAEFNYQRMTEVLGLPKAESFAERPAETFAVIEGKQIPASDAIAYFTTNPAAMKELIHKAFGIGVAKTKFRVEDDRVVLLETPNFWVFVEALTMIFGNWVKKEIPDLDEPVMFDWRWNDVGGDAIEELIHSLPGKDFDKLYPALIEAAIADELIGEDEDLSSDDYLTLIKRGLMPKEIRDALYQAIGDGFQSGTEKSRAQAAVDRLGTSNLYFQDSPIDAKYAGIVHEKTGYGLHLPIENLIQIANADDELELNMPSRGAEWDIEYDRKVAEESFKEAIAPFLKGQP